MTKLSFSEKLTRLRGRLRDSEWRRYGALLVAGKFTAIALLLVAFAFMNPGLVGMSAHAADPVLKGGTAAPSYKNAVLENGLRILVPPFIAAGEKIIVATEDGSYVRRAD